MVKATPKKSRAPFYGLLAILVVVGAVGIWYSMNGAKQAPIALDPNVKLPDAKGYVVGDPNAPVKILEFADFECPGCGQFATLVEPDVKKRIVDAGLASFSFFDFPLTDIHGNTMIAHLAASCANDQGKFWEMHDQIFARQYDWNTQATSQPRKVLDEIARQVGLNFETYDQCLSTRKNLPQIEANRQAGVARGVGSTPTLVIGDRVYPGGLTYDQLKKVVDSLVALAPTTTVPAAGGSAAAKTP